MVAVLVAVTTSALLLARLVAQEPTFRAGVSLVRVNVLATERGRPIAGLTDADFELRDASGRRIQLKDNGTWRYLDATPAAGAKALDGKPQPLADLQLLSRADSPGGCQFDFRLTNHLPYEIRSLVPDFAAHRANGVVYSTQTLAFIALKAGDQRQRALRFDGIACADISKLQVLGGDRCEIGEIDRFTEGKGVCLAQLRVVPSDTIKFEK